MKYLITLIFFCTNIIYSQVGIGTTTPSAELEIVGSDTGIPVLKLNPQSSPIGSETGQIAIIGDLLYMYDSTRSKWLSIESTALQFGTNGNGDNEYMRLGGDVRDSGSGAKMPYDGTITAITIEASGGEPAKEFDLHINGISNKTSTLVAGEFIENTTNINFSSGDYIHMFISANGGNVANPAAIIWVKWRE